MCMIKQNMIVFCNGIHLFLNNVGQNFRNCFSYFVSSLSSDLAIQHTFQIRNIYVKGSHEVSLLYNISGPDKYKLKLFLREQF